MASGWRTRRPNGAATDPLYASARHRQYRAAAMAALARVGAGLCCLGGEAIYPSMGRDLHADHCPLCRGRGCDSCGGIGYRGLACARHNRSDGARRGAARQSTSPLRW